MVEAYYFDLATGEFLYKDYAGDAGNLPPDCTTVAPPEAREHFARCWNGTAWAYVEDYRGTRYWLPEDAWNSYGHYMETLGPLPEGASLTPPDKPEEEVEKEALTAELWNIKGWLEEKREAIIDAISTGVIPPSEDYQELLQERTQKRIREGEIERRLQELRG